MLFFSFLIKNPKPNALISTEIWSRTTVFSIDNKKKSFLISKSAYYYDFWRSCDTEDWSNDAENTAAHHINILGMGILSKSNIR